MPGASTVRLRRFAGCLVVAGLCSVAPVTASDDSRAIFILDIEQGSALSSLAQSLGNGGYELSDTTWQSFEKWYRAAFTELRIDTLTQFGDDFGILWGASTGEWAEKYRLAPSIRLGVVTQSHPRPNATLTFQATTNLFGTLTELPCTADYGGIGGVQPVNCRLAATEMKPADTLKYLVKAEPTRLKLTLTYAASF